MNYNKKIDVINLIGMDIGKNTFHIYLVNEETGEIGKKKLTRKKVLPFFSSLKKSLIGLEACGSANYWARELYSLGHEVKILPPQYVKPYVKTNKNDMVDAEAILEAMTRPSMRFVPIKTIEQQDIQSLHRIRSRLIKNRTALMNEMRGLLLEYGFAIPKGKKYVLREAEAIIKEKSHDSRITNDTQEFIRELYEELVTLDIRVAKYDKKIDCFAESQEACKRLKTMQGVGNVIATALVSRVGNGNEFQNGRHMAAYFGVVPRQYSTGGKDTLLGISKRGDPYIRQMVVHGARSFLRAANGKEKNKCTAFEKWARKKYLEKGHNKAVVAIANKMFRIAWVILQKNDTYNKNKPCAA